MGQWKKLWDSQETPLKRPYMDLGVMQTHPLWDSTTGQQLERYQWHTGRRWNDWHQSKCQETASSEAKIQRPGSINILSPSPPPHRTTDQWHRSPHSGKYLRLCPITTYQVHFLQQAMLLKPRVKAALPNTQKHTQGIGEVTINGAIAWQTSRSQTVALSTLWALPTHRATKWWSRLPCSGNYPSFLHSTQFTGVF